MATGSKKIRVARSVWPFYIGAAMALACLVVRALWPDLRFDNVSLILFALALVAALLPHVLGSLPPLKSLKYGDFAAEFDEAISGLEEKVVASEASRPAAAPPQAASEVGTASWEKFFDEYFRIVNSPTSNVEKILAASILIEGMVINAASALGLEMVGPRTNVRSVVEMLAKQGLISQAERAAFEDFWSLRNQIVHGRIGSPTDEQTARI